MRVALYARVSTCNGQSPEMQLAELREYTSRRGWQVFSEYVDHGVSGAKQAAAPVGATAAESFSLLEEDPPVTDARVGPRPRLPPDHVETRKTLATAR